MHMNTWLLFEKYAKQYFMNNMKVLEIGPDNYPTTLREKIGNDTIQWDTLDLSSRDNVTIIATNEYQFPIANESYDIILSSNVIEHVRKTWLWLKEIARVCKTGGYVITINPVSFPYHESPFDCWRIYPDGMKALYDEANLKVLLSRFESLEETKLRQLGFRRIYPGQSPLPEAFMDFQTYLSELLNNYKHPKKNLRSLKVLGKKILGWPISCNIDTITIGIKER